MPWSCQPSVPTASPCVLSSSFWVCPSALALCLLLFLAFVQQGARSADRGVAMAGAKRQLVGREPPPVHPDCASPETLGSLAGSARMALDQSLAC